MRPTKAERPPRSARPPAAQGFKSAGERNAVLISVAEGGRTGKAIVLKALLVVQDLQGRSGDRPVMKKLLSGDTPPDQLGKVLSGALAMPNWES